MPIWQKQAPLFLFLRKENRKMTRFFERGTPLAEMERQMMMAPNFTPRSNGSAVLCRYRSAAAEVDCQSCVRHRRQSRQGLTCLHLTKRLQAGMVTVAELADAELVSDDTLLLILCAALIARYGPEVMNIGRAGGQCGSAGRAEQFQRERGPQMGGMV